MSDENAATDLTLEGTRDAHKARDQARTASRAGSAGRSGIDRKDTPKMDDAIDRRIERVEDDMRQSSRQHGEGLAVITERVNTAVSTMNERMSWIEKVWRDKLTDCQTHKDRTLKVELGLTQSKAAENSGKPMVSVLLKIIVLMGAIVGLLGGVVLLLTKLAGLGAKP